MTDDEARMFDIEDSLPHEVMEAARLLGIWFKQQGIKDWKLMDVQARNDRTNMTEETNNKPQALIGTCVEIGSDNEDITMSIMTVCIPKTDVCNFKKNLIYKQVRITLEPEQRSL